MTRKKKPQIELIKINEVHPDPNNAKRHPEKQVLTLMEIIKDLGMRNPVLVREDNQLIAGEGRWIACKRLGHTEIPAIRITDLDESQMKALALADNKISEQGQWDEDVLSRELKKLEASGRTGASLGFSDQELRALMNRQTGTQPNRVIEPKEDKEPPAIAKDGDLLEFVMPSGRTHRLLCGDSTSAKDVEKLMAGQLAQLVFTDPPYGVDYQSEAQGNIEGDKDKGDDLVQKLILPALKQGMAASEPTAAFYIWHASATRRDFEYAIDTAGLMERQYITWIKPTFVLGHADYHWQTEPCFYCHKAGESPRFIGDRKQSTVWELELTNDEGAASIANGITISDGDKNLIYIQARAPKAKKLRLLRLAPGKKVALVAESNTDAWQIGLDVRSEYIHPCLPAGEKVRINGEWKPIEMAEVGQSTDYGKIAFTSSHTAEEIVTIALEDGTTTKATGNHPFLIKRESAVFWIEARMIEKGDQTLTILDLLHTQKPCKEEKTYCQQKERSPQRDTDESTTASKEDTEWSTSLYGKSTTDQSQKGSRSTTETKTRQTIELKTWRLSTPLHTSGCTLVAELTNQANGKNLAKHVENTRQPRKNSGIFHEVGSTEENAGNATAKDRSRTEKYVLRTVGSVKVEKEKTTVYNLTIDGIPAFETAIGTSHNTQKPTGLAEKAINNHLSVGESVLDLFAGSGSTGIAAEITATRSYSMEKDPKFVNRIARRWTATFEECRVLLNGKDVTEKYR